MSNRRHSSSFAARRKRRKSLQNKEQQRKLLLESLERRELLAVGPQLIGIQPNNDSLLRFDRTDIRNVAPQELVFKFDENQRFSADDLRINPGRIQITRSGLDRDFEAASTTSDLATNDAVVVKFTAVRLGADQNGITINLTKTNQGSPGAPTITVNGNQISARLNTNPFNESTALDLVNAINSNLESSALIVAEIDSGNPDTDVASVLPANFAPIMLDGSNDVVITPGFIGPAAAPNENEIIVRFAETLPDDLYRIDVFGDHPLLALRNTQRGCTYNVNGQIFTGCAFGDLTEDGVDSGTDQSPIFFELDLAPQVTAVQPQPVTRVGGVLQQDRDQIVVHFSQDDLFAPDVVVTDDQFVDTHSVTIETVDGQTRVYELDSDGSRLNSSALPVTFSSETTAEQMAEILAKAVNETPNFGVTAEANGRQLTFNGDAAVTLSANISGFELGIDQFVNTAANPNFYKLFFTRETVENTDDIVFTPSSVRYDSNLDTAVLQFEANLDELQRTQAYTANPVTSAFTSTNHDLVNGDHVRLSSSGSLPVGLFGLTDYFVVSKTDNTFQLSTTIDGAPVNFVGTGTGLQQFETPIGAGVFRLRVGTDEAKPATPVQVPITVAATTDFNSLGGVKVKFESTEQVSEQFGTAIQVVITNRDMGPSVPPSVLVRDNRILIELNTNVTSISTAQDVVDAINGDGRAAALVTASIDSGNAGQVVGGTVADYFTIKLTGLGSSFETAT
ncbi:MAG: hypothetical protein QGH33_07405, partial [Pirellulaceae bacterium]|nr:hypothetical protein [Pirellulaceae bacterium]